mmetsp:Transcript_99551/g.307059  ORF Transcript_99551/g.307059 Transcript_99551/m.307059 type:complete len:440 (-) Transcript_99551:381-1700(-)
MLPAVARQVRSSRRQVLLRAGVDEFVQALLHAEQVPPGPDRAVRVHATPQAPPEFVAASPGLDARADNVVRVEPQLGEDPPRDDQRRRPPLVLQIVHLGDHQGVLHRQLLGEPRDLDVDVREAAVLEHGLAAHEVEDASQGGAPLSHVVEERGLPVVQLRLVRDCHAQARHVRQREARKQRARLVHVVEVEAGGVPRRGRHGGQGPPVQQGVHERALAHVGPAEEDDLGEVRRRHGLEGVDDRLQRDGCHGRPGDELVRLSVLLHAQRVHGVQHLEDARHGPLLGHEPQEAVPPVHGAAGDVPLAGAGDHLLDLRHGPVARGARRRGAARAACSGALAASRGQPVGARLSVRDGKLQEELGGGRQAPALHQQARDGLRQVPVSGLLGVEDVQGRPAERQGAAPPAPPVDAVHVQEEPPAGAQLPQADQAADGVLPGGVA